MLASVLLWQAWPAGSQREPTGVVGWDNRWARKEVGGDGLQDLLEMGAEKRGGQKQEVFDRDGVGLEDWIRRSVRSGRDLS